MHQFHINSKEFTMKLTITPIILAFTLAHANPQYENSEGDTQFGWKPPGLNDGNVSSFFEPYRKLTFQSSRSMPYAQHSSKPRIYSS